MDCKKETSVPKAMNVYVQSPKLLQLRETITTIMMPRPTLRNDIRLA